MRLVGTESRRTWQQKKDSGFFDKYMSGYGLEIGYTGYTGENIVPILDTATGIDTDYPGYDGINLQFGTETQNYVYSSHCIEHIPTSNLYLVLQEWMRVTKVGGHVVIVVPHKFLYEKKKDLPSRWNGDHKDMYTPGSLLTIIERCLAPNSYRVRLLEDGDQGFNYNLGPEVHSAGQYEITLVIQKIQNPDWSLD